MQLAGIKEDINNAEAGAKRALELLDRLEAERAEARAGLLAYAAVLPGFAGQVPDTIYQELSQQNTELLNRFHHKGEQSIFKKLLRQFYVRITALWHLDIFIIQYKLL